MKPKLFLIRYGDKVLLILLAGILVFAILMAVRSGPEGREQYGKDLEIAASEVEELLRKPPPPEQSELGPRHWPRWSHRLRIRRLSECCQRAPSGAAEASYTLAWI